MLRWPSFSLIVAIIAAVFGFGGIRGDRGVVRTNPVLRLPRAVRRLVIFGRRTVV